MYEQAKFYRDESSNVAAIKENDNGYSLTVLDGDRNIITIGQYKTFNEAKTELYIISKTWDCCDGKENFTQRETLEQVFDHGTNASYNRGCRCDLCTEAHRKYYKEYHKYVYMVIVDDNVNNIKVFKNEKKAQIEKNKLYEYGVKASIVKSKIN